MRWSVSGVRFLLVFVLVGVLVGATATACTDSAMTDASVRRVDAPFAFDATVDAPFAVDATVDAPLATTCGPPPPVCDSVVADGGACIPGLSCDEVPCGERAAWTCCICASTPSGPAWQFLFGDCFKQCDAGP